MITGTYIPEGGGRGVVLREQTQVAVVVRKQLQGYVSFSALALAFTTDTNTTIPTTLHQNIKPSAVSITLSILLQLIIIISITLGQESERLPARCSRTQTRQAVAGVWKSIRW